EATREVAAQDGVMERDQLGGEQPLEVPPERDLVELSARALERAPAERERLLAHAADEGGEPSQLGVRRQAAPELDLPSGRGPARAAEAGAPAPGLRRRFRELPGEAGGRGGGGVPRPRRHLGEPLAPLPRPLPEARLGGPPRPRPPPPPPPPPPRPPP